MILPDYPIGNSDEDKLRRAPLAKKVAELVAQFEGKESFVIGIEGIWGSGKTSFVNMVLKDLEGDEKLLFINFNPWNFSGQNELIMDFFSTLMKKVEPHVVDKNKLKKVKSVVSKLTKKSEIAFSPEISAFGGLVNVKAGDLFKFGGKDEKSLEEERKDIDDLFRTLGKKIVIVIDDIDRLDQEETRLIMKLVKMTANFPNTIFLLCYDREKVAEKLGNQGEEYMKKIIQVSFTLPKPDEQGLQKILFADLDSTIKDVYGVVKIEGNDEKLWNEMGSGGFRELFKTVRDIKRYISSLRLNWSIVGKDDVNQIDFIGIEAIRVFAPGFYSKMAANRHLFTGTHSLYASFKGDDKKERMAKFKEMIGELDEDLKKPIEGICKALFPQLDDANYGRDWGAIWKQDRRVCLDERFGFYFQLGIPEGAISETEANKLADTFTDKDAFSEKLLELAKDKRLRPMLIKVLDRTGQMDEEKAKVVISSLWDLEKEIGEERNAIFDFDDTETQVGRIAYHAIKNLPAERRYPVLEELVKNTKTFHPATRFVAIILDQHAKASSETLITKDEAEKLKAISLSKIKELAKNNKLHEQEELVFALYRWKEWEGETPVKEYIKGLVSTEDGVLTLISKFVRKVLSTNGNYQQLDKKGIDPLYPLSEIEGLVSKIEEDKVENPKFKEALELFRKPPEREW